jgi:hypothetical protein
MRGAILLLPALATLIACGGRTTSTTGSDESGRGAVVAANGEVEDAGTADGGGSPTGTGAPATLCKDGADCASGICFVGASRSFCSFRCTPSNAPVVCAGPFEGFCNPMGYCRLAGGP